MEKPVTTRLRYVSARDPQLIVDFLDALGTRVQIYGNPVWNGKQWFLWFVPGEFADDIVSVNLDE